MLAFLMDKDRLVRMAAAGQRYVLANHTRTAVARYMVSEILRQSAAANKFSSKSIN